MNIILLIFFAIPILVIVVSIALQKLLKCPGLVAAIIFAIFLVITFIVGNLIFLVATIIYAIISFITAVIICLIDRWRERNRCRQGERETDCCCNSNSDTIFADGEIAIANNFNNSNNSSSNSSNTDNNSFDIDVDTLLKIKQVMDSINSQKPDPRTNLLLSLKPYLKESRQKKVDQYIKLFNMEKVFETFNSLGGDSKNDV